MLSNLKQNSETRQNQTGRTTLNSTLEWRSAPHDLAPLTPVTLGVRSQHSPPLELDHTRRLELVRAILTGPCRYYKLGRYVQMRGCDGETEGMRQSQMRRDENEQLQIQRLTDGGNADV